MHLEHAIGVYNWSGKIYGKKKGKKKTWIMEEQMGTGQKDNKALLVDTVSKASLSKTILEKYFL